MAFTTLLMTVSMVAIASAGFPGWPANDSPFPGFPSRVFDFDDQKIKPSKLNQFKNFDYLKKIEDFNNFDFRHTFPAIDPKKIETYVPGEEESFKGHSIRTHTFSSNNNGQVKEGGSSTKIDNDNGHVTKVKVVFNSDGTQP